jgi:hypothetical protein
MSYLSSRVSAAAALALLANGCLPGDTSVVEDPLDADPVWVNDFLGAMAHDLESLDPADRADVRYVTLTHLQHAGATKADLETYRAAVSLALNSVSTGLRVKAPVPVDADATILRIRLEDYGWDADTWQRVVEAYPYDVRYNGDSEWFELRDDLDDELRDETETSVAYVHGDWLVSTTMQPRTYYDLLALPDTLEALEHELGIDTRDAIDAERVDRAGFARSSVSTTSRVIERFTLPDSRALWRSCDLAPGASVLDEPLEFTCAHREAIVTLANGMPAYYSANTDGVRQDLTGLSCTNCHGVTGTIPKLDEVRDFALTSGAGANDVDTILALYPTRSELSDLFARDNATFATARRATGARDAVADPLSSASARHALPVTVRDAAATLGVDVDTFREMLSAATSLPADASPFFRDGELPRATWDKIFADTACALGLSTCD